MEKKQEILSKIKEYVNEVDSQAEVFLFGSRAKGEEREDSDWDILILTPSLDSLQEERKFRHKLLELELEYEQPFSTFVYAKSEWYGKQKVTPLFKNVQREGIRL